MKKKLEKKMLFKLCVYRVELNGNRWLMFVR